MDKIKIPEELQNRINHVMYLYWTNRLFEEGLLTEEEYSKLKIHFRKVLREIGEANETNKNNQKK